MRNGKIDAVKSAFTKVNSGEINQKGMIVINDAIKKMRKYLPVKLKNNFLSAFALIKNG